jgi:Carbohydrate family 9 binding domain-like
VRISRSPGSHRAARSSCGAALLLLSLGAGPACVERGEDEPTPEELEIIRKDLLSTPPAPKFPVNASLDDKVVYLGLDVSPNPVEPGKTVILTHYWKVKEPPGKDWRVFTHAQGPGRAGFINVDHQPMRGKYPVSQWKAGDIIRDQHAVSLPASWNQPALEVYVGLWRGAERMPVRSGPHDQEGRVLAATIPVKRSTPPLPTSRYLVRRTRKPIRIDGVLDEAAWKAAATTGPFVNLLTGAPGEVKTDAKLLWDDKNLYIALENADPDVWGDLEERDAKLASQDAVEVLLHADGNGKSYIELQVSPRNTVLDAYLPEYRKYEDALDPARKPHDWTSRLKSAVKVHGTLNQRDDQDRSWTVELALPLADAKGLAAQGVKVPPALGDTWRINLFRFDAPRGKGQVAVAWSPPLSTDIHALGRFGTIVFVDEQGFVPISFPEKGDPAANARMRAAHEGLAGGMPPNPRAVLERLRLERQKQTAESAKKAGNEKSR